MSTRKAPFLPFPQSELRYANSYSKQILTHPFQPLPSKHLSARHTGIQARDHLTLLATINMSTPEDMSQHHAQEVQELKMLHALQLQEAQARETEGRLAAQEAFDRARSLQWILSQHEDEIEDLKRENKDLQEQLAASEARNEEMREELQGLYGDLCNPGDRRRRKAFYKHLFECEDLRKEYFRALINEDDESADGDAAAEDRVESDAEDENMYAFDGGFHCL